jgi:tetratricopeptide (TPR) repeat protein
MMKRAFCPARIFGHAFLILAGALLAAGVGSAQRAVPSPAGNAIELAKAAENLRTAGEHLKAIKLYTEALAIERLWIGYYGRALAYLDTKQFALAKADLDEAIRLKPDIPYFYSHRARALEELKQFKLAVSDYTKAIELDPGDVES